MKEPLHFETRNDFRNWLSENGQTSEGVWLLFAKTTAIKTLKASEALEEALCFGWIDGVMKRGDDRTYIKYFARRQPMSKWSEKNKKLVTKLDAAGEMTAFGQLKIAEAQKNGQWHTPSQSPQLTDELIDQVANLLKGNAQAYANFREMSPSVQKTYTKAYLDAKTEAGKEKRFAWMIARLEKNLKPM